MNLTPEQEALKTLAKAASQGSWQWDGRTVDEDGYVHIPECSYLVGAICLADNYEGYQEDCDFMAAANPRAILALIAQLEAAQEAPDACELGPEWSVKTEIVERNGLQGAEERTTWTRNSAYAPALKNDTPTGE